MKTVIFLLAFLSVAHAREIPTVSNVDIDRYIGKWYSISALPQFFTRNCLGQTADYGIINDQTISVLNTCLKGRSKTTISGQAVVTNATTNAELEVTFDSFFTRLFRVKGDYNILKLDRDYKYVLIGSRDRKSLWIMSRTPVMPKEQYDAYVEKATELGFPTKNLKFSKF